MTRALFVDVVIRRGHDFALQKRERTRKQRIARAFLGIPARVTIASSISCLFPPVSPSGDSRIHEACQERHWQ
jgi:hypothetical protein